MAAIRVELELADGQFVTRMLHAGQTIRNFNGAVAASSPQLQAMAASGKNVVSSLQVADGAAKGFLGTLRDVSIVAGLLSIGIAKLADVQNGWLGDIVRINAEMQRLNFQMQSMSSAADPIKDAGESIAWMRKQALEMPFTLQSIANSFVKLKSTGTDPLNGSLNALADGIAAFGGTDESLNRATLAISQMSGKGVIQMEELRQQLGESMPRAVELMARSMGISMAQLIDDISTGTVQSKEALVLFYDEIERTYGGRAAYMMETFDGQLKKIVTTLQLMSTDQGAGFFEAVEEQAHDLADFLSSGLAKGMAQGVGDMLENSVRGLRTVLDQVFIFRRELMNVGAFAAFAVGTKIAVSGLSSLSASIATSSLMLKANVINLQSSVSWFQLFGQGALRTGTSLMAMQAGLTGIAIAGRAVVGIMATMMPWVAAIGLGIYAAGEYFGWFSNRVNEAYEDLKAFGAETRAQAQEIAAARRKMLQDELVQAETLAKLEGPGIEGRLDEVLRAKQALADFEAEQPAIMASAATREDQASLAAFQRTLDAKIRALQGVYDREQTATQAHYEELRTQAVEAGKSTEEIETERGKALNQIRLDNEMKVQAILQESIESQERMLEGGTESQKAAATLILDDLYDRLVASGEKLDQLRNWNAGSPMIAGGMDDDALYKKGEDHLKRLQSEVTGLEAALQGTSQEAAELGQLLASNKYGDMGRAKVVALTESIMAAQIQKEKLDEILKGKEKLEADVERARMNALEERLKLEEQASGRTLSESEKIKMRIEEGYYAGFGPAAEVQRLLEGIVTSFDVVGDVSNAAAINLRTNTFGDQTVSRIQAVSSAIRELAGTVGLLNTGLDGTTFSGFQTGILSGLAPIMQDVPAELGARMEQVITLLMQKGWSRAAAAGMAGNFVGESGIDPNITNPDDKGKPAGGIAQWRAERLEALKSFAAETGRAWTDLTAQIDFLDNELNGTEGKAGAQLRYAASPEAAAEMFMRLFERPEFSTKKLAERQGWARQAYDGVGRGGVPGAQEPAPYTPGQGQVAAAQALAAAQAKYLTDLEQVAEIERGNDAMKGDVARKEYLDDLLQKMEEEKTDADGLNKTYAATIKLIEKGKLGTSKDAKDPMYRDILETAKELDAVETTMTKRRKEKGELDTQAEGFAQRQLEITNRIAEANARMLDPLQKGSTSAFRALRSDLDAYLADISTYYGEDSAEYADALAYKADLLRQFKNTEIAEFMAGEASKTTELERSLMSESQRREATLRDEVARIDKMVAEFNGSEQEMVMIVEWAEQRKKALRAEYSSTVNPFMNQMREWGDLQTNLANAATGWMDSLSSGIADLLVDGKSLQDTLKNIAKEMLTMGIRYGLSQMMGGGGGAAKGGGTAKVAHTGGIMGADSLATRTVDYSHFVGAPRFHTGGIIGRDEMPIIAQKGEGMFTKAQMEAIGQGSGGMRMGDINMPITVQGSAGSPEQNQDLAERTRKEMTNGIRAIFAEELRNQQRVGNSLGR